MAELSGDDRSGLRVIARDHDGAHAGAFRSSNRAPRFLARRIDHSDQPEENETLLDVLIERLAPGCILR